MVYAARIKHEKADKRAALSLYYVLKYVGEIAFSALPMFWAASRFRTRYSKVKSA
jgi:hypothetical protein